MKSNRVKFMVILGSCMLRGLVFSIPAVAIEKNQVPSGKNHVHEPTKAQSVEVRRLLDTLASRFPVPFLPSADSLLLHSMSKADSLVKLNDSLSHADSLLRNRIAKQIKKFESRDTSRSAPLQALIDSITKADSLRGLGLTNSIRKLKGKLSAYPVVLDKDTLFSLYLNLGSFSALERAKAISNRISEVAKNGILNLDSIGTAPADNSIDILYGSKVLVSITESDAFWFATTKEKLAMDYAIKIRLGLEKYRKQHAISQILFLALKIVIVLILFCIVVYLIRRVFRWLKHRVLIFRKNRFTGFHFRKVEMVSAAQHMTLAELGLKA